MIDPNKGCSDETLRRLKEESYERFRIELFASVKQLLDGFQMTWQDLADRLQWEQVGTADLLKQEIGAKMLTVEELNQIAHCFSADVYLIFRPRYPWTNS